MPAMLPADAMMTAMTITPDRTIARLVTVAEKRSADHSTNGSSTKITTSEGRRGWT